ncbi:MAG: porphobilinogen synthase [SAR324 cluster bacterium]|nr:porphobilinogen synthase [SAR324 cluster bacterium]
MKKQSLTHRLRRVRKSPSIRDLVAENTLSATEFIQPIFVTDKRKGKQEIASMPGIFSYSLTALLIHIEELLKFNISTILLFPLVDADKKDKYGSLSRDRDFYYFEIIKKIKSNFPEITIATDVALDPYTDHGHDGVLEGSIILNDETLPLLADMAVAQAEAGADIVAPSDMMDGRVAFIRRELDNHGFTDVLIMSYSAKYASAFYGPFRGALGSSILKGDKKTYQMDYRNGDEALREAKLDLDEGADIIIVKPGLAYIDVVKSFSDNLNAIVAVYNVSGEYTMLKLANDKGFLNYESCVLEIFYAFKRAGANIIISYSALEVAKTLSGS